VARGGDAGKETAPCSGRLSAPRTLTCARPT
jgi:hypothetical protein